ncbi:MAG: hypothetical protein NTV40_04575 [Solirubrobacterales bacterium]|nr:hypothetical protein [Solirubrobacterales bacterium]
MDGQDQHHSSYAGVISTYCRSRLVTDPTLLAAADVVVVGAPFDDGVSNRPARPERP